MAKDGLTAKRIEHAKPDPDRRIELSAGPPGGLYLTIHPSGKKVWNLRYRYRQRTRKGTLGVYPELTLAKARLKAVEDLARLDEGIDPYAAEVKIQENPDTVKAVAEEWIKRHVHVNVDWPEAERILRNNIVSAWEYKLITEITKADVLRLLDAIVDRGAPVGANRTLAVMRAWLNWCVGRGILVVSPAAGIQPPTTEQSRDRVLDPGELAEVWNVADALGYPLGPFVKFLILVAQRRGEVAHMQWSDVDMQKRMWTLPSEATKARRIHDVPLSNAAFEILQSLPRFTQGDYVWTTTRGVLPINGFSKSKNRIDAETLKRRLDAGIQDKIPDWTLHDLRRTAATHMASAGVAPHVLAAILNHTPGSTQGVTSIYNRFRYTEERRAALEAWSTTVLSLETKEARRVG